jgi:hypothetical protein
MESDNQIDNQSNNVPAASESELEISTKFANAKTELNPIKPKDVSEEPTSPLENSSSILNLPAVKAPNSRLEPILSLKKPGGRQKKTVSLSLNEGIFDPSIDGSSGSKLSVMRPLLEQGIYTGKEPDESMSEFSSNGNVILSDSRMGRVLVSRGSGELSDNGQSQEVASEQSTGTEPKAVHLSLLGSLKQPDIMIPIVSKSKKKATVWPEHEASIDLGEYSYSPNLPEYTSPGIQKEEIIEEEETQDQQNEKQTETRKKALKGTGNSMTSVASSSSEGRQKGGRELIETTNTKLLFVRNIFFAIIVVVALTWVLVSMNSVEGLRIGLGGEVAQQSASLVLQLSFAFAHHLVASASKDANAIFFGYLLGRKQGYSLAVVGFFQSGLIEKALFPSRLAFRSPTRKLLGYVRSFYVFHFLTLILTLQVTTGNFVLIKVLVLEFRIKEWEHCLA